MTADRAKKVRKEYPLGSINSAIARFLKDGRNITRVIETIRNSGFERKHLKSLLHIWKGFGNLDYWHILLNECRKEDIF